MRGALNWRLFLAWLPAHALYAFGDLVSRVLNRMPDWEWVLWRWLARALYVAYNKSMLASLDLNDWAGLSLWRK